MDRFVTTTDSSDTADRCGQDEHHDVTVQSRVTAFVANMERLCAETARDPQEITIALATKTQQQEPIRVAICQFAHLGYNVIAAENRVQELVAKQPLFAELNTPIHLIGPLQSNKINATLRALAASATSSEILQQPCIETVGDLLLAQKISARVPEGSCLNVMVQVNASAEPTKSGVLPDKAVGLAREIMQLPRLKVIGLMTIGPREATPCETARCFETVRALRDEISALDLPAATDCTELSMGMSADLPIALACGATVIRPGRAIFGARN